MDSDRRTRFAFGFFSRRFVRSGVLCALGTLAVSGCSKSPYEVAPVHGKVTINKQPLASGKVMFAPAARQGSVEGGKPAVGIIQSDGSYALTTFSEGDGAIVGEHWVTVFVPDPKSPPTKSEDGALTIAKFKRRPVSEKKIVSAGTENEIDVAL